MPHRNSFVNSEPTTPRRSPRFLSQHNHNTPNPKSAKRSVSKPKECCVGLRRSPRLNNVEERSPPLRRSSRFNNEPSGKKLSTTRVQGAEAETKKNRVVSDEGFSGGAKNGEIGKRVEVKTKENRVVLDEGSDGGRKKKRNRKRVQDKTKENRIVSDNGDVSDDGGGAKKRENGEKRKRVGEEISKGWTEEQELALQRAYFAAKPSPNFWKNVCKLVPGKSSQDCFDKIHSDHITPPQTQRRSRAKTLNSSPLHEFSISASKLLKPTDKTVRKSNVLKPKNIIMQKSVEKLLQRHLKVDLDCEADIFSVLEPNIDVTSNALQPSAVLSTPKQLKENKEFLQICTETSSSSHKKPLSRLSGAHITDLASPPVLKKVKNRLVHEKYINQLRCREARRRAASKKINGEGSRIQKNDVVKAAKVALVSEARNVINKFQQSQVNFMGNTCSSDEDNDDDIEFEDESQ